nr:MAG TPA: hypothetical protein [Microviridae sp.]
MRARACVCAYLIIFSARFIGHVRQRNLSLQFRKIKSKKMFPLRGTQINNSNSVA